MYKLAGPRLHNAPRSHVARKIPPDVAKERLGFVEDRVDLVVLAPSLGRLPSLQGVLFVAAKSSHVSGGYLVPALHRSRGSSIHRLGGLTHNNHTTTASINKRREKEDVTVCQLVRGIILRTAAAVAARTIRRSC